MKLAGIIVSVLVLLVGVADIFLFAILGPKATISHYVLGLSEVTPTVPLFFGYILGHLFWPQKILEEELQ